jgi:outer membrane protein assembly factor BamB/16S rRNA G966 N2-methylase RsmD
MYIVAGIVKGACCLFVVVLSARLHVARAADWPMFGRDKTRNSVVAAANAPTDWDVVTGRNIKWTAKLGSTTFAAPVVAGGHVYIGTNNGAGYLERYPNTVDLGCLLCFRESDGKFLWQYSAEKLPIGRVHDWPLQGLVSSPLVEGERAWFVSNRHVVVCLDTQGFTDNENDGPYVDEPVKGPREADVVWQFDLISQLGVFPHPPGMGPNTRCSIAASYKNRIYVVTGNGVDESYVRVPAPDAPSLVCLDKDTGKVLWTDASPGKNILDGQSAHPLVAEIEGRAQVIVPQGDGWIRGFDALTGEVIWWFDINPKESVWILGRRATRNSILATPVLYKGRVYIGSGQQVEHGEGPGRLVCINPAMKGDISSELAVDKDGKPLSHRREQAVDPEKFEKAVANPNSGLIWEFTKVKDSKRFTDEMHRTLSTVAIHNELVIAPDFTGLFHCLDADTGKKHWSYDPIAAVWGSPLIVGNMIYVGDENGDVSMLGLSPDPKVAMKRVASDIRPLFTVELGMPIYSSPVFANDVLYIATRDKLYAIAAPQAPKAKTEDRHDAKRDPGQGGASGRTSSRVAKPIFAPTPQDVVEKMFSTVQIARNDTVVDLGSGDGRIVITAAKQFGVRAIGYEIDADLVKSSRAGAKQAGVAQLVDIRQQDVYTADLSHARVVTVFLYPPALAKLKPSFAAMQPGARIISHHYEIPGVKPDGVLTVKSKDTGDEHRVLLYTTPLAETE